MSLSKLVRATLKKEKASISLYLCSSFCIILFYYFLYDNKLILYPILVCCFCLGVYLVYKFFIYKSFYESLEEIKTSPAYHKAEGSIFEDVFDEIREIHNNYISKIYALEVNNEEKEKLLIEWIHNMKTSVAVIHLALEKLPNEEAIKDIRDENSLLQMNLEGALNIFRLGEFSKDYVPEAIHLKDLVKESIHSQKRNFIYASVFPEINIPEDYVILSDKKWSKYVMEQVISNAIKYSFSGGKVCFYAKESENEVTLYIQDSGVGIKKEELSRVFDAFFTGSNGRKEEKSTGIGLYMCKCICDNLNDKIEITSEVSKGTTVSIRYLKTNQFLNLDKFS
ncbi:sensor histidine kinase [Bacillus cereus group sp. BfR-BA-01380]|uniref:sensor histidine kinase n=1 Tax=Bacillus cereus group sp. BfR-BA-01380 TaxID=2920324 RepID=UPI001F58F75C|nr:sensor histidine kinase [Bacillus cereus group sp. BfR-BA-01380]